MTDVVRDDARKWELGSVSLASIDGYFCDALTVTLFTLSMNVCLSILESSGEPSSEMCGERADESLSNYTTGKLNQTNLVKMKKMVTIYGELDAKSSVFLYPSLSFLFVYLSWHISLLIIFLLIFIKLHVFPSYRFFTAPFSFWQWSYFWYLGSYPDDFKFQTCWLHSGIKLC